MPEVLHLIEMESNMDEDSSDTNSDLFDLESLATSRTATQKTELATGNHSKQRL